MLNDKSCWVCGVVDSLHSHHVFGGTGNRKESEKHDMKLWLCGDHHNLSREGIHFNRALDLKAKRFAQEEFEKTHSREYFMTVFGRNYL